MRIALVQCPAWGALPPLGPAALKAYVEQHGHEARCFDLNIQFHNAHRASQSDRSGAAYGGPDPWGADSYDQWSLDYSSWDQIRFQSGSQFNDRPLPLDDWADQVMAFAPAIVGFSIYLTSLAASLQLAERIKERDPSVTIVFGGPNVASDSEGDRALQTGVPDVAVDGEGEAALVDVARALEHGEDLREVAGIGLLVDRVVVWTEKRPLIPKVDSLPYPDFGDLEWTLYPNPYQIPIMSSRGCVLRCSFCYETVYWKRFRTQSPERIVGEMEHQVSSHPLRNRVVEEGGRFYFIFADSLVNGHVAGLRRMCSLIIERGLDVGWGGQATINKRMDAEYCQLLREAGCGGLAFGLESGSQRVLESMGKHFHIDDAPEMIKNMHDAGVMVTLNVMVGFPTETWRDFAQTLWFLAKTRKWISQVSNVTTTQLALGSDLYQFPEKYGVVLHPDNTWISEETGDEANRHRRLRILHRWMSLIRIPHQRIATPPGLGSQEEGFADDPDELALASEELLERIGADHGGEPVVIESSDGIVVDVAGADWADWLGLESWVGLGLDDLEEHLEGTTGGTLAVSSAASPGPGVQHLIVTIATDAERRVLHVYEHAGPAAGHRRILLHTS